MKLPAFNAGGDAGYSTISLEVGLPFTIAGSDSEQFRIAGAVVAQTDL